MSDQLPAAQKQTSGLKIVLIVLLVLFGLGLLACGGIAALTYFGFDKIQQAAGEEFQKQLAGNPTLEEEVGKDFTLKMDLMETGRGAQENQGKQIIVFNVEGSKASGVLIAEPSGNNKITKATLELSDGRVVEIPIDESAAAAAEPSDGLDPSDIDLGTPPGDEPAEAGQPEAEQPEAEQPEAP